MKYLSQILGYVSTNSSQFHVLNHSRICYCENGEMTCKWHTLESIIKRIYPTLNFSLIYFTFPLKFGLDILWLPYLLVDIQYSQYLLKWESLASYVYFHVASSRGYLSTILTHFPYFRVNQLLTTCPISNLSINFII